MDQSITSKIIGAAIEVHRHLGPGLLEFTYEICLAREFDLRNIKYQRQRSCSLIYKDLAIDGACRIDFLIENEVVLEVKSVETFSDVHTSQVLIPKMIQESVFGFVRIPAFRSAKMAPISNRGTIFASASPDRNSGRGLCQKPILESFSVYISQSA